MLHISNPGARCDWSTATINQYVDCPHEHSSCFIASDFAAIRCKLLSFHIMLCRLKFPRSDRYISKLLLIVSYFRWSIVCQIDGRI